MKKIQKYLVLGLLAAAGSGLFTACRVDEFDGNREPSPIMPTGNLGVYFPSTNKAAVEVDPADPTVFSLTIARVDSSAAAEVPITVEVNTDDVFNVPATVSFAENQRVAQLTVEFPNATVGKEYTLKVSVAGDAYVNQYAAAAPYFTAKVTRIKWSPVGRPFVYIEACVGYLFGGLPRFPMYVEADSVVLGDFTRYRLKNIYRVPTTGNPDVNGIYDGYPYCETGDLVDADKDWYAIIEINNTTGDVSMGKSEIGMDWGYGGMSIGSIYGVLVAKTPENLANYPLGKKEGNVIVFPANSLFIADDDDAAPVGATAEIYLTLGAFLSGRPVYSIDFSKADSARVAKEWSFNRPFNNSSSADFVLKTVNGAQALYAKNSGTELQFATKAIELSDYHGTQADTMLFKLSLGAKAGDVAYNKVKVYVVAASGEELVKEYNMPSVGIFTDFVSLSDYEGEEIQVKFVVEQGELALYNFAIAPSSNPKAIFK